MRPDMITRPDRPPTEDVPPFMRSVVVGNVDKSATYDVVRAHFSVRRRIKLKLFSDLKFLKA